MSTAILQEKLLDILKVALGISNVLLILSAKVRTNVDKFRRTYCEQSYFLFCST